MWKWNNNRRDRNTLIPLWVWTADGSEGGLLVARTRPRERELSKVHERISCHVPVYLMNGCLHWTHTAVINTTVQRRFVCFLYLPLQQWRPVRRHASPTFCFFFFLFLSRAVCWRSSWKETEPLHIRYKTITISCIKDKFIHMYAHMLTSDTYFTVCVCALV